MNPKCYENGSCIICGCETTALQMASKTCDGKEYPPMVSKYKWENYMIGKSSIKEGDYTWVHSKVTDDNKPIILKLENGSYNKYNPIQDV